MNLLVLLDVVVNKTNNVVSDTANVVQTSQGYDTLSYWELTLKGGPIMIVLGILLILVLYIFFERYFVTNKAGKEDQGFMMNIKQFIKDGKIDTALAMCRASNTPLSRMIEKGVSRIGRPLEDIAAAIENVGKLEVAKLEKSVAFLSTIASVAPSIGFLGTVTGMINAFYNLSKSGNNIDISMLSGGIYEAMVTTVGGLIVGILASLAYNIIVGRIEKIVFILEARATEFMDILNEPIS
ncbi:MAG: MotA/TolQ/ExbB proton channel family protein [Bacteroidales bacterium]|nr:MotA/TolQ/ExbB proton channel family protein [Bacteroidales bacterium]